MKQAILFDEQEKIDAKKRALRVQLDSFHVEPESELHKLLNDARTREKIGRFIALHTMKIRYQY